MRKAALTLGMALVLLTGGCANQTTDPHQGGLFSYNPKAYEQRIAERKTRLSALEKENQAMQQQGTSLAGQKAAQEKQLAELKSKLAGLASENRSLQDKINQAALTTEAQNRERQRILAELDQVRREMAQAGAVTDPREKQKELERLKEKQARLAREVEELTRL